MSQSDEQVDVFVVGGGINGTGIARDAAGRGYTVMLAEMNDLASGTSSAATKLIHGGLRYLEYYKFRLVREALAEREILWTAAPHIIRPMRFVLPYHHGLRPAWLLRLGLFAYDHLGGRKLLPPTRTLDLAHDDAGKPLQDGFRTAFEYSDCWVDDARLVVLNAQDAKARGARIATRTKVVAARRSAGGWDVDLEDLRTNSRSTVRARLVVNAAGPWVDTVLAEAIGSEQRRNVRLVKGSHIVTRRLFPHDRSYFFQNADGRIFFAIPYEGDFTLIGTTDLDYDGDPATVSISEAEVDYLLAAASDYFREPVVREDIVWSYSGVRPLFDDGASAAKEATRDYVLKLERGTDGAPIVNVFGGKLTTYRRLSQAAVDLAAEVLGRRGARWTRDAKLPGGEFAPTGLEMLIRELAVEFDWLDPGLLRRMACSYGTRTRVLLGDARHMRDLGSDFGAGLFAREVDYLMREEFAETADDVLWRRSKLGLRVKEDNRQALAAYMAAASPRGDQ